MKEIPEWLKQELQKIIDSYKQRTGCSEFDLGPKFYREGFKDCFNILSKPENAAKLECVKPLIMAATIAETYHQGHNSLAGNRLRAALKPFKKEGSDE